MANNFRLLGNYYISKGGHDSNDGLTPDTAKKSIPSNVDTTRVLVIGSGSYKYTSLASVNNKIIGDGTTIIDFQGQSGISFYGTIGGIEKIHLKNSTGVTIGTTGSFIYQYDCIFDSLTILGARMWPQKSIFINCSSLLMSGDGINASTVGSCIIFGGSHKMSSTVNTYSSFDSSINYLGSASLFKNSNIEGLIDLEGVKYAIQDQFTGAPQDNGYDIGVEWLTEANLTSNGYTGTIIGWDAAVATCINRDPRFNDASKGIFTLKADSPHLGRAFDGVSNIGGTDYEDLELVGNLSSSVLLSEVSEAIDNTTNVNDWVLKAGYNEGYVRIIKKVTDSDYKTLAKIPYYGNYSFDSDEIGGTSGNFNVPDSKPQTNQYPEYTTTTSDALDVNSIIIAGHGRITGEWIRVEGQDREISSVDTNTIYFLTAVRAIVLSGTNVKIGSESELAALTPNRLNMELRTSKAALVDASNWNTAATWDNDNLATAGNYLAQELNNTPMIDNLNGVGFGDDLYDSTFGNKIRAKYVDLKIWIRNNYKS